MSEKATVREIPGVAGWGTAGTTRPEHPLVVSKLRVTARVTRRPPRGPQRCHQPRQTPQPAPPPGTLLAPARGRDRDCARAASGPGLSPPCSAGSPVPAGQRPAASGRACKSWAGAGSHLPVWLGPPAGPSRMLPQSGLPARPGSAHAPPRKARPSRRQGASPPRRRLLGHAPNSSSREPGAGLR